MICATQHPRTSVFVYATRTPDDSAVLIFFLWGSVARMPMLKTKNVCEFFSYEAQFQEYQCSKLKKIVNFFLMRLSSKNTNAQNKQKLWFFFFSLHDKKTMCTFLSWHCFYINPNKSGMPAATKGGACWKFLSNYCCTLPTLIPARATSWRKNSNWYKPRIWYCTIYIQNGLFFFWFFAIFNMKTKLF